MLDLGLLRTLPPGARYQRRADGFAIGLPEGGSVWLRERVRPLRAAAEIFADVRRELGLPPRPPGPITRLISHEGELGAWDEAGIGVIFGDDFYRVVAGRADPALLRRFTVELPLGLAHRRRRLYGYQPPTGWAGRLRHRLIAEWLAPGYPGEPARITVFPARPFGETAAGELDRQLHELTWDGYQREAIAGPDVIATTAPLTGVGYQVAGTWMDGRRSLTDVVLLQDGAFSYCARLDHTGVDPQRHRAVLAALVHSIQPVASPRAPSAGDAFAHLAQ